MPDSMLFFYRKHIGRHIAIYKKQKRHKLFRFIIHLTDHCNLNCAGCEHFSPLADEKYLDKDIFEKDCIRLNKLTGGAIDHLSLVGGEPLLHPCINDILCISRKYFPVGQIRIITNGILLEEMPDLFWKTCSENKIDIIISVYPIKLNHLYFKEITAHYGINLFYRGNRDNSGQIDELQVKKWRKLRIDISGNQDKNISNKLCYASNGCYELVNGKLYKCHRIANIEYFNKAFNCNLNVTKDDYIDIYKANNITEILEKIRKPAKFCRYCNMLNSENDVTWGKSNRKITEWI